MVFTIDLFPNFDLKNAHLDSHLGVFKNGVDPKWLFDMGNDEQSMDVGVPLF